MIKKYTELLKQYKDLPILQKSDSIFDIAGYPHYENVCSNILQFYFNPFNEHGLGNLFLRSLSDLVHDYNFIVPQTVSISREYGTLNGGRLDLVITTDTHVIGIENKIFHILNNDLDDYEKTLNEIAKVNNQDIIKIVLSLKPLNPSNGFVSITYRDLWDKIRSNLGFYSSTSSQKWLLYLLDFMNTIENFTGGKMDISTNERFLIENNEIITQLIQERNNFQNKLRQQINELENLLGEKPESCIKRWIYAKSCLVHDFEYKNEEATYHIAFDLYIDVSGWELQLFGRNNETQNYLNCLKVKLGIEQIICANNRYVIEEFELGKDLNEISQSLKKWLEKLDSAVTTKVC